MKRKERIQSILVVIVANAFLIIVLDMHAKLRNLVHCIHSVTKKNDVLKIYMSFYI